MPHFISTNGLAGDVMVIEGIISRRQIEISSLREQIAELEKTRDEEAEDIKHGIKDLEKQLEAARQAGSQKPKDSEIAHLQRKRLLSLRGRDIELEDNGEGKVKEDLKSRIRNIESQLKETTKERPRKLKELEIAYLMRKGPIIERIDELQQLNDHDRSLIAPIRKLPAELLGYVFQRHVDLDNSPWVLTLVSRSWRHTAMTTPSLWVNLLLYSAEHRMANKPNALESWRINKSRWYSMGRRVVCHDPSELNTIISRAGSLPLDIHISYRNDNASLVQLVFGDTTITRRVASLSIDGSTSLWTYPIYDVAGVKISAFPLIHTLTLHLVPEKFHRDILKSISSSSPHLRRLTMDENMPLSLEFSFWSRLRSLNLKYGSTKELLNNLIPHLGQLEILEGCPQLWPDNFTPEVTLANLKTLEVFCFPEYLRKLRLPALLHLSIGQAFTRVKRKTGGEPLISLPALEILDVVNRDFLSWLAMLSAPSLRVFILRQSGPIVDSSFFQKIHFPTVQDFTLDYPCTGKLAISALECVPNAERVAVSSTYPRQQESWVLELLQYLTDAETMLCPHMTHFTLGSPSSRVVVHKTSAKARARRAIKNRMDRGVKMDHFEIHFKAREESVQYA